MYRLVGRQGGGAGRVTSALVEVGESPARWLTILISATIRQYRYAFSATRHAAFVHRRDFRALNA